MVVHHRPFRRRQEHAAQADRRHRATHLGQRGGQRPELSAAAPQRDSLSAPQLRPDLPGPQAALRPQRARQRDAAAADRRPAAARGDPPRARRSTRSACWRAKRPIRSRCPAASSSAWRSPAPSSTARPSCSPTSRPATSTPTRPARSWKCSPTSTRSASRVVIATHDPQWIVRYHPNVLRLDHGRLVAQ